MRLCHYPSRHSESGAGREGEDSYEPLRTERHWGEGASPPGVLMLTGGYSLITSEGGQWSVVELSGLMGR